MTMTSSLQYSYLWSSALNPTAPPEDLSPDAFDNGQVDLTEAREFCNLVRDLLALLFPNDDFCEKPSLSTQNNTASQGICDSQSTFPEETAQVRKRDRVRQSADSRRESSAYAVLHAPPRVYVFSDTPSATTVIHNHVNATTGSSTTVARGTSLSSDKEEDESNDTVKKRCLESDKKKAVVVVADDKNQSLFLKHTLAAVALAVLIPLSAYLCRGDYSKVRLFRTVDSLYDRLKKQTKKIPKPRIGCSDRLDRLLTVLSGWKRARLELQNRLKVNIGTKTFMAVGGMGTAAALVFRSVWGLWGGSLLFGSSLAYRAWHKEDQHAKSVLHRGLILLHDNANLFLAQTTL